MPANRIIAQQQVNKAREMAAAASEWREVALRQKIMMEGLVKLILQLEGDSRKVESELYELGITNPSVAEPSATSMSTSEMLSLGVESLRQQRTFNKHIVDLYREENTLLTGIIEDTRDLVSVPVPKEDLMVPRIEGVQMTEFETLVSQGDSARQRRREEKLARHQLPIGIPSNRFLEDINRSVNQ